LLANNISHRFIRPALFLLIMCFGFSALFGCSSTPTVKEMTVRMRDTDDIKVTDMRSIVSSGLLTAQVTLENKGAKKPVTYRFRWINQNGLQIGGDEAWKPVTIRSGQVGLVTGIAPHPSATDFRFELTSD